MNSRIAILAWAFFIGGCSYTATSPTFAPSGAARTSGIAIVEDVRYAPARRGTVKANQLWPLKSTVYFDATIEDYVRRALVGELEHAGVRIGPGGWLLDATVRQFGIDEGFARVTTVFAV